MNLEIISKIKATSIIFFISFVFLISTYAMYQTLDINAGNLKMEAESLQDNLKKLNEETKKNLEIANKAIDFINQNSQLYFINVKDQFEFITFNEEIKNQFQSLHPNSKFSSKGVLNKTKTTLFEYPFEYEWSYKNPYYLETFFVTINKNFFYNLVSLEYDTTKKLFKLKANLYAKETIKSIINPSSGNDNKNTRKRK